MKLRKSAVLIRLFQGVVTAAALIGFSASAQADVDLVADWPQLSAKYGGDNYVLQEWLPNTSFRVKFSITNLGPDDATSVSFERVFPPNAVIENTEAPSVHSINSSEYGEVVFPNPGDTSGPDILVLPSKMTVDYVYTVSLPTVGSYEFSNRASSAETDRELENNFRNWLLTIVPDNVADVSISNETTQTQVAVGEEVTFRFDVTNHGPGVASVPYISIWFQTLESYSIDPPLEFVSGAISTSGTVLGGPNALQAWPAALNPGETATVTGVFRGKTPGTLHAMGSVNNAIVQPDPNMENNALDFTFEVSGFVPEFDLKADLTISPETVQPGGLLVEQLVMSNLGPDDATDVSFNIWFGDYAFTHAIVFERDLDLHSIFSAGAWDVQRTSNSLMGTLPSLAAGESSTVTLVFKVKQDPAGQQNNPNKLGHYFDVASNYWIEHIGSDIFDVRINNRAFAEADINRDGTGNHSDLAVIKSMPTEVPVGKPFTYTVQALNLGPAPITSGRLSNMLPAGASAVKAVGDSGTATVSGRYVSLDDVSLNAGESATLRVNVIPKVLGTQFHEAGVASSQFDPNLSNNMAGANILVKEGGPVVGGESAADPAWLEFDF